MPPSQRVVSRTGTKLLQQARSRSYATTTGVNNLPQVGEQLHGFTVKRTRNVPELELTALHLQHDKTGAEYLHVARDDKNNVFSIGFKTNPPDKTGVPHILEHLALCGSEKSVPSPSSPGQSSDLQADTLFATPSSR